MSWISFKHSRAAYRAHFALYAAAPAHAQVSLYVNLAPPPPHYEVVPVIPPGHVWAPGYWGTPCGLLGARLRPQAG